MSAEDQRLATMMAELFKHLKNGNSRDPYCGNPTDKAPDASVPTGTGRSLATGVEIWSQARTVNEQQDIGIQSKHSQGRTEHDRGKTKRRVCIELDTKISCLNLSSLLSSNAIEKYDIIDDCAN